ncbi:MAG: glycosyltransferase family 4 protein [Actinobacteria bacterium]|nr:glycosyltransferase family 4 protein [Actinomycetota bacterium]MCO5299061.1 glycosyltransferase family 4 protein [Candidatus Nanopelagicales bacterium]
MHVLHLTWEYPPVVYGGLGRHVHALSRAQAAAGHEVTVVTQQPEDAAAEETIDGVRIVRVSPVGPFPYHLPSLLSWVGFLDDAIGRAGMQQDRVEVVHVHDWVTGRAGTATAEALEVPLVATVHATEAGRHRGWLPDDVSRGVHLIERWLVDEADSLIVCSQSMATEVQHAHSADPARITVIPNGIDASVYSPHDNVAPDLLEGSPRISFVGRIEWEKGVFTAVEAMPAVLARYPRARLRIVGTGGQSAAVADLVARSGLTTQVQLLGHVDEPTLRAVYTSSDLVIAPSSYEPFGIVALEAAAMGVPLVVGDTGGLAEFVTDQRGRRCRPNDAADLAAQIVTTFDEPEQTARRRANASLALSQFTWNEVARRTAEVYDKARRRQRPARVTRAPANPIWE